MKYLDEYRDPAVARRYADAIARVATRPWTLMEICGGQTHSIVRHGIDQMLPEGITLLHGPGCPVCVTPSGVVDAAVEIARRRGVIFCSFGDMLRVPGAGGSLLSAKARGADVRMVYSPLDAVAIARDNPDRDIVFFAIGFETTAPTTAMAVLQAERENLTNFSMLVSHVLVPPAIEALLSDPDTAVQGFLAAGHVCTVMGFWEYEPIATRFHIPIVVTGFEPVDLLAGILMAVTQLEEGRAEVENQYSRSVKRAGNEVAQAVLQKVFAVQSQGWRGMGEIPASGLGLAPAYARFDALVRFPDIAVPEDSPGECISGEILRGAKRPADCPAFGTRCTPEHPLGATMVSSEGTCAAYYRYRRPPVAAQAAGAGGRAVMAFELNCPIPEYARDTIEMGHGGGGLMTKRLIDGIFRPAFGAGPGDLVHDGALLDPGEGRLAFTTDSFVVRPLTFPGGDIGSLAVNGTVNDLAMCGAEPLAISVGMILEEGLPVETLRQIAASMRAAADRAGVRLVTGDTKVVERGKGDGIYINTSGIGRVIAPVPVAPAEVHAGDAILLSGDVGRHGVAIMAVREGLGFETEIVSDCAPLVAPVRALLDAGIPLHCLRDLTRGGLATALAEIAETAALTLRLDEHAIPVSDAVRGACEILGLDPFYVANEGRFVAFVPAEAAGEALAILRGFDPAAARIGRVEQGRGEAVLDTLGGLRPLDLLSGEQLPRIC